MLARDDDPKWIFVFEIKSDETICSLNSASRKNDDDHFKNI